MALVTEREKGAHLLRRFGLGASEAELNFYLQGGLKGAINKLVDYESIDEGFNLDITSLTNAKNKVQMPGVVGWWILRILQTQHPLQEKMTLFWHDHFATSADKVKAPMSMYLQNEILRRNAVGNFGTMLSEVSKDPAMIVWLDNEYNVKGKANENFAREVMELFTLGIGHYTEKDIQESARAYTGWSLQRPRGVTKDETDQRKLAPEFVFRPRFHDDGDKVFFGQRGNFSGDDILAMLCKMPRTAEYISHKMWEFFAYRDPEPDVIRRISSEFHQSNLDIKTLLRSIMNSPEFYSAKAERAIYKNPVDFTITTARQLGLGSLMNQTLGQGDVRKLGPVSQINTSMKGMGMQLLYPPDVAGWDQGASWITTATMVERISWAERLFPSANERGLMRFLAYPLFSQNPTPSGVANKLVSLFDAPLPPSKLENLAAAAERVSKGTINESNANLVAQTVTKLIFASPEFQFC